MAEWPTVAAVKVSLGVDVDTRDDLIAAALAASIEQVGYDLGYSEVEVIEESDEGFTLMGTLDTDVDAVEIVPNNSNKQELVAMIVGA